MANPHEQAPTPASRAGLDDDRVAATNAAVAKTDKPDPTSGRVFGLGPDRRIADIEAASVAANGKPPVDGDPVNVGLATLGGGPGIVSRGSQRAVVLHAVGPSTQTLPVQPPGPAAAQMKSAPPVSPTSGAQGPIAA